MPPSRWILIVEDDEAIRESIMEILESEGYPVGTAADGQQAIQLLRDRGVPGLILLDFAAGSRTRRR